MSKVKDVHVGIFQPQRFKEVLSDEAYAEFEDGIEQAHRILDGRRILNVNSTAKGGGVAEMLQSLLAYARGAGVDARWAVIDGDADFFRVTKRLHNHLHGAAGDDLQLGEAERDIYERTLGSNATQLRERTRPGDIVLLHDPQTIGLVPSLKETGVVVIWRCHIGTDSSNDIARTAWRFLRPYLADADAYVFSRKEFVWEGLDPTKTSIIAPSIDAFSPKNQELDPEAVAAIVAATGLVRDGSSTAAPVFRLEDGSPARVDRRAALHEAPPPPTGSPLVVQVSRWDRLKDPVGVVEGFAELIAPRTDAHLIVAGPEVEEVADDPEGAEVLAEVTAKWDELDGAVKERIHLACLPMEDTDENAAIVNALQRTATVVVQKSIAEGFGLTVAEAMWKARPVVASAVGGIQDQIEDGTTGVLVDDPRDLESYADSVVGLLDDVARANAIGERAQERIRSEFLGPRHLLQYLELTRALLR